MRRHCFFCASCLLFVTSLYVLGEPANVVAEEAVRTWIDSTGKHKREGVFVRLDGDIVLLRLADGAIARIPLNKLSPADQSFAKAASTAAEGEPDPFQTDPGSQPFELQAKDAVSEPSPANLAGDATLRIVVVEGVGTDVESAKADAYRQAVRQVVGAFVDTSTMVDNDKLIEDRVITLSSALVEKVETISESRTGGLVRIRVRAHVRATKLLETLNANRITTVTIDTESLVAQAITSADQQQGAEAILAKQLPKFHEQVFAVSVVGQPAVGMATGDSVEIKVRVALSPNMEAFQAIAEKIQKVLDATPRKHGEIVSDGLKPAKKGEYREIAAGIREHALQDHNWGGLIEVFADETELEAVEDSADRLGNSALIKYDPLYLLADPLCTGDRSIGVQGLYWSKWDKLFNGEPNGNAILMLLTKGNASFQRTTWRWFLLSGDDVAVFRKYLPRTFRCTTRLLDRKGEEISRDVLRLKQLGVYDIRNNRSQIHMSPFFVDEELQYYTPYLTFERTITLQKAEVAAVGKAEVTLSEESEP